MPTAPRVPEPLTHGPFTVTEALLAGLSRRQLQGRSWRRISTGVYVWTGLVDEPLTTLRALLRSLPREAAFSDRTAGWLHGLDLPPCLPVEVAVPHACGISRRAGIQLRRTALDAGEIVRRRGLPVTTPLRTAFDPARHLPLEEAVVAVDMALHAGLVTLGALHAHVAGRPTSRGAARARRVVALAEPRSEWPMETRLRLLLVRAGLPRPEAQAELRDSGSGLLGRVDLYYPERRLVLEYDGGTHRDSLAADNRRQNRLLASGCRLLRFTAAEIHGCPRAVVGQVRSALRGG